MTRRTLYAATALAGIHLTAQWIAVGDLAAAWGAFTRAWDTRPILLGLGWLAMSVAVGVAVSAMRCGTHSRRRKRND